MKNTEIDHNGAYRRICECFKRLFVPFLIDLSSDSSQKKHFKVSEKWRLFCFVFLVRRSSQICSSAQFRRSSLVAMTNAQAVFSFDIFDFDGTAELDLSNLGDIVRSLSLNPTSKTVEKFGGVDQGSILHNYYCRNLSAVKLWQDFDALF